MKAARQFLVNTLKDLGFETQILKGKKHDLVFAERTENTKLPTVLIYGHYDVQPPEPLNKWLTEPFKPTIKKDLIFGRGAADNKGQIMIHIATVKKLLTELGGKLPVNFKFIIEGEEEIGSISIDSITKKYATNLLKCNYLVVSDTEMPKKNQPSIDTSLRGLMYSEITIQTAQHDLHSGLFGGIAENPINVLSRIIADLKGEDGFVNIPGFYDDVVGLTKNEVKDYRKVQVTSKDLIAEGTLYGIGGGEAGFSLNELRWARPTLDVNGIWGGYQEEGSKTIIPYCASAKISTRLVPNQKPEKIFRLLEKRIKKLTPKTCHVKVTYLASCLPYKAPIGDMVLNTMKASLKKSFKKEPILKGVGGSIGFVPIVAKALKVPCLLVGFALPDDNVHAPNEHFSLTHYFKGIETMVDFYTNLGKK